MVSRREVTSRTGSWLKWWKPSAGWDWSCRKVKRHGSRRKPPELRLRYVLLMGDSVMPGVQGSHDASQHVTTASCKGLRLYPVWR